MPNDPPTISYAVTSDGEAWRVACGAQALGRFTSRSVAFEAAMLMAEDAVRDGRRAEVVCAADD